MPQEIEGISIRTQRKAPIYLFYSKQQVVDLVFWLLHVYS